MATQASIEDDYQRLETSRVAGLVRKDLDAKDSLPIDTTEHKISLDMDETISMIPLSRNTHFFGREFELNQLVEAFSSPGNAAIIWGMGGIGKTQIALAFAYLHRRKYDVILWFRCETELQLLQSYSEVADGLNLVASSKQNQHDRCAAVLQWMRISRKWMNVTMFNESNLKVEVDKLMPCVI